MLIRYIFADGSVTEVEVADDIGNVILNSRREEAAADRKEHRHCYSLDAIQYEGAEYGVYDPTDELYDDSEERAARVDAAFSHLSETQKRRLRMLADGMSIHDIARTEGKNYKSVYESIEAAKKKFKKLF